jgi:hypothetical protein
MMLPVVNLHGASVDMRLKGVGWIWKRFKLECHESLLNFDG